MPLAHLDNLCARPTLSSCWTQQCSLRDTVCQDGKFAYICNNLPVAAAARHKCRNGGLHSGFHQKAGQRLAGAGGPLSAMPGPGDRSQPDPASVDSRRRGVPLNFCNRWKWVCHTQQSPQRKGCSARDVKSYVRDVGLPDPVFVDSKAVSRMM
jgi:hypothetical protein